MHAKLINRRNTNTDLSFLNYILKKFKDIICGTQKRFPSQQHSRTPLFPAHYRQDCTCLGATQMFTQGSFPESSYYGHKREHTVRPSVYDKVCLE